MKRRIHPSWCCQECGEHIGWLGRFFTMLWSGWHKCSDYYRDKNTWGI